MQDLSLNFRSSALFSLTNKIKASVEGRMDWGDTFGIELGTETDKYLIVWTPKTSSEAQILPRVDSEDGKLSLKMKSRPGAWASWIDKGKIAAEITDDYNRVRKSVQELDRNARQVVDFADGVLTEITVQHLGKSLTLAELSREVLQVELTLPSSVKTGSYILTNSGIETPPTAKVIIPEQTNIHRVHLNEDELFESLGRTDCDALLVVFRTHAKCYPDLADISYSLTLNAYLRGKVEQANENDPVPNLADFNPRQTDREIEVFPTAAVYDPLQPDTIRFAPISLDGTSEQIREAITACSSIVDAFAVKASRQAFAIMSAFERRIETRLKALVLQPGQRVHDKVWDELVNHDLRDGMFGFSEFFREYVIEHFHSDISRTKHDELKQSIDPMIESWQIYDVRQRNLKNIIVSGYTLANQVLDRATGLLYDLLFERHFIESGFVHSVDALVLENGEVLEQVPLPTWTKKSVRERLQRFALNSSVHPKQIERLRTIWRGFLEISNFATQCHQKSESILQPLVDLLLMLKQPKSGSTLRKTSSENGDQFKGFEVSEQAFDELLLQLQGHFRLIRCWIANMPKDQHKTDQYYATLWMILTDGKIRERLNQNFRPLCDINLSVPLEAKRLMDLVLSSQVIIHDEKDLSNLKRNLDRALLAKSGHGLRDTTTPSVLAIHGDSLFLLLRRELVAYQQTLAKRASRLMNSKSHNKRKKTKRGQGNDKSSKSVTEMMSLLDAEMAKVTELIDFLTHYTEAATILVEAGVNSEGGQLERIRRHQVMNFDLQELPPIEETWLSDIKSADDYPNLRAFLLEYQLPISTTGRRLMHMRKASSNTALNGSPRNTFRVVLQLVQELKTLQAASYEGEVLERFMNYLAEKLWRWEATQITANELPTLIKEKVLASAICYGEEVEALLEYVERYDLLCESKIQSESDIDMQWQSIEKQFQQVVDSIL